MLKLSAFDGSQVWRYRVGLSVQSSPGIGVDGTIYFGSNDDYIYALNPDGTLRWRYLTGGDVVSSPAVTAYRVYVGSDDGSLYALTVAG